MIRVVEPGVDRHRAAKGGHRARGSSTRSDGDALNLLVRSPTLTPRKGHALLFEAARGVARPRAGASRAPSSITHDTA
jgi:hypothetical protein